MASVEVGEKEAAKESFQRIQKWLQDADRQHSVYDPDDKLDHDMVRLERMIEALSG